MLSQSHNLPTNFLELCKALETFCHPISESPLHFPDGADAWEAQTRCRWCFSWRVTVAGYHELEQSMPYSRHTAALSQLWRSGWVTVHNLSLVCRERAKTVKGLRHIPCKELCDNQTFFQVCPGQRDPKINLPKAPSPRGERSRSREWDQAGALSPVHRPTTQIHAVDRVKNNSSISI